MSIILENDFFIHYVHCTDVTSVTDPTGWVRSQAINVFAQHLVDSMPVTLPVKLAMTYFQNKKAEVECDAMITIFPCHVQENHWTLAVLMKQVTHNCEYLILFVD